MGFQKGREKTGGKKKGSVNKEKKELQQLMAEKFPNWHPVIAMTEVANDNEVDIQTRLIAMKEVSKYVAPQLKAVELTNPDGSMNTTFTIIRETKGLPTAP